MKKVLLLICSALVLSACGTHKNAEEAASSKSLVLYYSQLGTTKQLAQLIQQRVGADIEEITLVTPYDTSFQKTIERCQQEMKDGILPEINPLVSVVDNYDTIYIGYPIWFGTYAPPIATLLKNVDFTGKVIVPFCTFGSGGIEASRDSLMSVLPENLVLEGYGVRAARIAAAEKEIDPWLIRIEALPGEFVPMLEFGELQSLTPETQAIFDEACGDYPMPLGTPVSVASTPGNDCTHYCFETESQRPNGEKSIAVIYVIKPTTGKAEFTKVIR